MAKLPQSLASGDVPGGFPQGTPSARAWAAPGAALGDFGEMAERESQKWFVVEQKLQESRNAVFKSRVASRLSAFTDDYISKIGSDKAGKVVSEEYATAATRFLEGELQGVENEGLRNAILAHANLVVADGSSTARRTANTKVMKADQDTALLQIKDLREKGTPEAMQEALDLMAGMTAAGLFSAHEHQAAAELIRKDSVQNAFGRVLAADPAEAFRQVNEWEGMFSRQHVDEATHYNMMATAKSKLEHDQDRAWTVQRRLEEETARVSRDLENGKASALSTAIATGTVDVRYLEGLMQGWSFENKAHIRNFLQNLKMQKQHDTTWDEGRDKKDRTDVMHQYLAEIPLADAKTVWNTVRSAEIAYANGSIKDVELGTIRQHAQQQLAHLETEARLRRGEARQAEGDELKKRQQEFAVLKREVKTWLGVDPSTRVSAEVRKAESDAENALLAEGSAALYALESPREWAQKKLPEVLGTMYEQLGGAKQEMWRRLAPYTTVQQFLDAEARGEIVDPVKLTRMTNAVRTLQHLSLYEPQAATAQPGAQPAPAPKKKSWTPLAPRSAPVLNTTGFSND